MKTFAGLPAGTKFKAVENTNGHNYPLNTPLTMNRKGIGATITNIAIEVTSGNCIQAWDCELYITTIEEMKKQLAELDAQKAELQAKIDFCEETDVTEYDENLFKVYKALEVIETKTLSRGEKAALISKLIN